MSENSAVKDDTHAALPPFTEQVEGLTPDRIASAVEAILLSLDKPITASKLASALGLSQGEDDGPAQAEVALSSAPPAPPAAPSKRRRKGAESVAPKSAINGAEAISAAVESLNAVYESTGRSFRIEKIAGGFRLMTLPTFAPILAAFHGARSSGRLGKAAVETLSIIAYKQPITRAHLEAIRGVGCGEILRSLLERRLVTIKGRAEELGRPILYGTTKEFLDAFGLSTLKDLPTAAELQGMQ